MARLNKRQFETIAAFQRFVKTDNFDEIEEFELAELIHIDEALGNRDTDSGYRRAIQNRIRTLEDKNKINEQRNYESKVRIWNLITGIVIGLFIATLTKIFFD